MYDRSGLPKHHARRLNLAMPLLGVAFAAVGMVLARCFS